MKHKILRRAIVWLPTLAGLAGGAWAAGKPVVCVWDIMGTAGSTYSMAQDYAVAMGRQGVDLELKSYINERIAVEDFRTGQCVAALMTGFKARQFNKLAGSLDSMGSTTVVRDGRIDMPGSYEVLRRAIQVFSSPQANQLMQDGAFEIGGLFPLGAAYPMLRDRSLTSAEALAGKKVAVFDDDKAQGLLIQMLGAQPVSVDVMNVGTKFNNGMVDLVHLPAMTYKPFELAKGMGSKGAVVRMPVMMPTIQLVLYKARFPEGFGQQSRAFWAAQFDRAKGFAAQAETGIPAATWYDMPKEHLAAYARALREGRLEGAKQGIYSKRTLNVLQKTRCGISPTEPECSQPKEIE
ncbi:putative solute-binding protein [Aquabacterium sp.]|uniref:putative solute-binding protein n=1 Tax=Aquabacterium sp. TaxID=1872578 RepID=UPI00248834DB|nr:putative solute-binding protein [Aquabacterium sp.]MDI1260216.1 DUF6091 family protein [Aquabacterium sp.]